MSRPCETQQKEFIADTLNFIHVRTDPYVLTKKILSNYSNISNSKQNQLGETAKMILINEIFIKCCMNLKLVWIDIKEAETS